MIGKLVRKFLRLFARLADSPGTGLPETTGAACRAGSQQEQQHHQQQQSTWLQAAIREVSALAESVGTNVGQHTDRITAVSRELEIVLKKEPSVVVALATRMLAANEELQARLNQAEQSLLDYSRKLNEALATARTDALTGLLNRRALDDELQRCVAQSQRHGRPAALLLVDVDHFKQFNDRFGHPAGDEVLKRVAHVLRNEARETDTIARYGGEEFVIVLTSTTAAAVRMRAEQIRGAIGQEGFTFAGQTTRVTASAGLAEWMPDESPLEWLRKADEALYAAKRNGRDCAFWKGATGLVKMTPDAAATGQSPASQPAPIQSEPAASSAFTLASLEDEAFVRRLDVLIDQWKRGGATLTVILVRLRGSAPGDSLDEPVADFIAAARELAPTEVRLTRWQGDGVALLLPDTDQRAAKRFARQLCEAFGGAPNPTYSFQLGMAEGQEGNTALRILERAAIALAACSGPFEVRLHDGLKAVSVQASPVVRRTAALK